MQYRFFEKVSYEQFSKDTGWGEQVYSGIRIPRRATRGSSGYDFYAYQEFVLMPGQEIKIPTGVKVCMPDDEWLAILVRSGAGFKYNIRLKNQIGNIDHDYYNNPDNEGHIFVALKNEGDRPWVVREGEAFAQGIFLGYKTTNDDNPVSVKREGGLGSTTGKEEALIAESTYMSKVKEFMMYGTPPPPFSGVEDILISFYNFLKGNESNKLS